MVCHHVYTFQCRVFPDQLVEKSNLYPLYYYLLHIIPEEERNSQKNNNNIHFYPPPPQYLPVLTCKLGRAASPSKSFKWQLAIQRTLS